MIVTLDRAELQRSFPLASQRVIRTLEVMFQGYDIVQQNPNEDIASAASNATAAANQSLSAAELASRQAEEALSVANSAIAQMSQDEYMHSNSEPDQLSALTMNSASTLEKIYLSDGSINTDVSYKVAGTKVVGPREAGWTAFSGTVVANKAAYSPANSYTVSVGYVQAEVSTIATALVAANARIRALEEALRTHGLIT